MDKGTIDMRLDFPRVTYKSYAELYRPGGTLAAKFNIKNVIFNDPATIVFWQDGTKTVVKCSQDDMFDPEKGLAMAIVKRAYGDGNEFHKIFKEWLPEEEEHIEETRFTNLGDIFDSIKEKADSAREALQKVNDAVLNNKEEPKWTRNSDGLHLKDIGR